MMGILFGIAKIGWGLTKFTYRTAKLGFRASKKVAKGSWKAFLTGRKVGKSAIGVIRKSRALTQSIASNHINSSKVPTVKESTLFTKK